MIDAKNEKLISFADAGKSIPGRPHLSQIYRWSMRGLRGVRLEWIQIGGRRYTSREALDRFFARLTSAAGGEAAPITSTAARKKQITTAERELVDAGFEVGG